MQTLGLSDSTPRTESRLKSLFWPTIGNDGDLDYLTEQGFWICSLVAAVTFGFGLFAGGGVMVFLSSIEALFYFLAGVGVRMRSRGAAVLAFAAYLLGALVLQKYTGAGFGVVRVIFLALLLANVRGIWLSASWIKSEGDAPPMRLNETWHDKLSDQLPAWLWPKARAVFYILATIEIGVLMLELFPIAPAGPHVG